MFANGHAIDCILRWFDNRQKRRKNKNKCPNSIPLSIKRINERVITKKWMRLMCACSKNNPNWCAPPLKPQIQSATWCTRTQTLKPYRRRIYLWMYHYLLIKFHPVFFCHETAWRMAWEKKKYDYSCFAFMGCVFHALLAETQCTALHVFLLWVTLPKRLFIICNGTKSGS